MYIPIFFCIIEMKDNPVLSNQPSKGFRQWQSWDDFSKSVTVAEQQRVHPSAAVDWHSSTEADVVS